MAHSKRVVGIDVSKERLDCCLWPEGQQRQVSNDAAGWRTLLAWMKSQVAQAAVLEATAGFERGAATSLRRAGFTVRVVDPKRVRHYGRAIGRLAKNDRLDARLIAEFAAVSNVLERCDIVADDPAREDLGTLVGARQDLQDHQTALAQQAAATPAGPARHALRMALKPMARAIARLERRIAAAIAEHPPFATLARRLDTVPGLGPVGIAAMIAWLPELGLLEHRQIAALVGVAPFDDDSGKRKGQRYIQGGRLKLRNVLYMVAMGAATRHNPILKAHYQRLRARGKDAKLAIIACLRKLLTILNTMIARHQDWQPRLSPAGQEMLTA